MSKRNHSAEFKAKVALGGHKGEETMSQIASCGIHPAQVRTWKR